MNNDVILMMYSLMLVFVLYMSKKMHDTRKLIKNEKKLLFMQRKKIIVFVLVALLIFMAVTIQGIALRLIVGAIAVYFIYLSIESISISQSGIYHNGRLVEWEQIKQWEFNQKNGDLVVTLNAPKNPVYVYPFRKDDTDEVNKIIKDFKGKNKKHKK